MSQPDTRACLYCRGPLTHWYSSRYLCMNGGCQAGKENLRIEAELEKVYKTKPHLLTKGPPTVNGKTWKEGSGYA